MFIVMHVQSLCFSYLQEIDDWVKSINKMIKNAKSEGKCGVDDDLYHTGDLSYWRPLPTVLSSPPVRAKTFEPSYNTALKCLTYLSEDRHVAESRAFVILSGNRDKIKGWLECVDRGEVRTLICVAGHRSRKLHVKSACISYSCEYEWLPSYAVQI